MPGNALKCCIMLVYAFSMVFKCFQYFAMRFNRPFEWLDQMAELETSEVNGVLEQELSYVPVFAMVFKDVVSVEARVSLSF